MVPQTCPQRAFPSFQLGMTGHVTGTGDVMAAASKKMSERQTKAGNQKKLKWLKSVS